MSPDRLRNWLSSLASELRDRRLLPVLVVLIAAAIAIPLLLSKSGHPANVASLPPAPSITVPSPSLTTTTVKTKRPPSQNYLTGPAHDPFAATSTTTTASGSSTTAPVSTSTAVASSVSKGGGSTAQTVTVTRSKPATTITKTTPEKTVTKTTPLTTALPYTNHEVEVSLSQEGVDSPPTVSHNLERDQLLPTDSTPITGFLGVLSDKTTAVFIVPDAVTVTGAGQCAPSADACTFLELQPGDKVTLTSQSEGGSPSVFTLTYDKVTPVRSTASTIAIDPVGADEVDEAKSYVNALKTITYTAHSGLLSINVGPTVAVNG